MKKLFDKIIQTVTVILIFWIVVFGIGYAQSACCSMIPDTCIPASDRVIIDNLCRTSLSHHGTNQLQPILYSKKLPLNYGAGDGSNESNCCDDYKQTTFFNPSSLQNNYTHQKNLNSFDVNVSSQRYFESKPRSTSLQTVPIYILTQSIIC